MMSEKKDGISENLNDASQTSPLRVNINMQQGEHARQPIYSNFSMAHNSQGVVFVDFGFIDPQAIKAINRMTHANTQEQQSVSARMSCRMAINLETAHNLHQQLIRFLQSNQKISAQQSGQTEGLPSNETASVKNNSVTDASAEEATNGEKPQPKKRFRFPWSSSDKKH